MESANDEYLPFLIRPLTQTDAAEIAVRFGNELFGALDRCRRDNRDAIIAAVAKGLTGRPAMRDIVKRGSRLHEEAIRALDDLTLFRATVAIVELTKRTPGAVRLWRAGHTALRRLVGVTRAHSW